MALWAEVYVFHFGTLSCFESCKQLFVYLFIHMYKIIVNFLLDRKSEICKKFCISINNLIIYRLIIIRMKKTFLLSLCLILLGSSFAQTASKFAVGINSNFLAVPLTEESFLTQPTDVYLAFSATENFSLILGFDNMLTLNSQTKAYDNISGLMLGAAFDFWKAKNGYFSNEVFATATNAFNDFGAFKNYSADLGVRFKFVDTFYLGTGFRWSHNESGVILPTATNSLNLFFQLGAQFTIGKSPLFNKK